ncbi:2-C-methyl-D-erythritol 4-phosphate cytidylyltransferase [Nocardioides nanhaiensis]|uniref:2-C-methyl-D-erythritol 4-phosphate cytidylyltransferase n=1 Tax=Nocardioides nanhaiensis TaxID=1476871 RepID=A0ABP8VY33_9ACTN
MSDWEDLEPDLPPALGTVLEQGRGSLPFALLHGEALVTCAVWALGESGVTPVDLGTDWSGLAESGEPFCLHDSLCPMTPASFIADCMRHAVATDAIVVGVRPVTDTVKQVDGGRVGATVDREGLQAVCSPVVLPPRVVRELAHVPAPDLAAADLAELVRSLGERHPVELREAPPEARRVLDVDDVALLEALTTPESRR